MAFRIYKKDKFTFEFEGEEITFHFLRLSAKKEMLFSLKVAKLAEKNEDETIDLPELYDTYAELFSEIVFDVEGIDRQDLPNGKWADDPNERKQLFLDCGAAFLNAAVSSYNAAKEVPVDPKK